ncbi:Fic family protein [Campylobacter concisus]
MIIHPYDDGNGRITRALAHYFLKEDVVKPFYISSTI